MTEHRKHLTVSPMTKKWQPARLMCLIRCRVVPTQRAFAILTENFLHRNASSLPSISTTFWRISSSNAVVPGSLSCLPKRRSSGIWNWFMEWLELLEGHGAVPFSSKPTTSSLPRQ